MKKLVLISVVGLVWMGCSKKETTFQKTQALKETSVFGEVESAPSDDDHVDAPAAGSGNNGSDGTIPQAGGSSQNTNQNNNGTNGNIVGGALNAVGNLIKDLTIPPTLPAGADSIDVILFCNQKANNPPNDHEFKRALTTNTPIELKIDGKLCSNDKQKINTLVQKRKITRTDLKNLCPSLVPATGDFKVDILVNGEAPMSPYSHGKKIDVYWSANNLEKGCDVYSSPLVIHMASDPENPQPIMLSSQRRGVWFDLLGANNEYEQVKISWFTNDDYRFLALPDRNGEVRGIDELFGDNTQGPDGKFADNGYAALAKFDVNNDQVIDRSDDVFKHLRLWLDSNRDGIGQAAEMTALAEVGLASIDLDFSTDYAERDRYGNETKMKSVVTYENGSVDLIFDLWFSHKMGGR